jgi:hypothetical protein
MKARFIVDQHTNSLVLLGAPRGDRLLQAGAGGRFNFFGWPLVGSRPLNSGQFTLKNR